MLGFGPSTYGEGFADVYDEWYGSITDATATAAFVAARRGDGPVLELGVGSGRLIPALMSAGCQVIGIDASPAMLDRAAARLADADPSTSGTALVRADLQSIPIARTRKVGAALCAFNTLFNLPTEAAQARLLTQIADALAPGGCVVIEAITGNALDAGPASSVGVSRMTADQLVLSATLLDRDAQTIQGQHVEITEAGIKLRPWMLRWTTPEQLDRLADRSGLVLDERVADWHGSAFTNDDDRHISVYRASTEL